jgi:choice-of-anchor C domain-containing protein
VFVLLVVVLVALWIFLPLSPRGQGNATKPGGDKTDNLLMNGSFEEGPEPAGQGFTLLEKGSTVIRGWQVTQGNIDYVGSYWQPADGKRSIDLNGTVRGGIGQTFKTKKGQKYRVTFSMAGNPNPDEKPALKRLGVSAAGKSAEFDFDTTGRSFKDMGWVTRTWEFTAVAGETTLEFYSLSEERKGCGPTLDNVSVSEVQD